jgi:hypothetical protein
MVKTQASRKGRDQVNLVFSAESPLARRLREAERTTGQPRTQIARDIIDAFLDVWLKAELAKRSVLDAARSRAVEAFATSGVERLGPRYAGEGRPESGYSDVVAARRPMRPRLLRDDLDLEVAERSRYRPRGRTDSHMGISDDDD